jgi:mannosyltransferase
LASATTTDERPRPALTRRLGDGYAAVAAVTLLAAIIRVPTLAEQSFWLDEGYTERLMRMSFGSMLHTIPRTESTPPLYYALAWIWTHVFTTSEFGLRSLSALAGIATIPVAYRAADRLSGRRAGLVTGLLLAVSPLMVWFSQEARAYALAALLATVTLLCLIAFLQDGGRGWLAGWAIAAALGLATHYFVAFVVAPEVAALAWRRRARWGGQLSAAVGLIVVVGVALVPLALVQRGTGHTDYIAQGSLGTRIAQVPKQLLIGYASPVQLATGVVAALLLAAGAVLPLITRPRTRARALLPLAVGVATVLVPIVLAVAGVDFLNTRNLLVALPPLAIAAGIGFAAARPRALGIASAGALALLCLIVVATVDGNARYQRDDWRGVSRVLGAPSGNRAIVVNPGSGLIPLQAYQRGLAPLTRTVAVSELDVVVIPAQVTGGGIGSPPPVPAALAVPAGFHALAPVRASTYLVLRYRAATPTTIAPTVAVTDHLGSGSEAVLLQTRGR